jgi:hypothetical protein
MIGPARSWEELKRIKGCGVFFFPDAIYVVAAARTVPGFEIDSEPVFKLDRQCPPLSLGDAVLSALKAYRMDVAPPGPSGKNISPFLKQTGKKSWKQLERIALHASISLDGATMHIIPTERDASRGGYTHRPDLASECTLDAQDIGTTLLRVFEQCS